MILQELSFLGFISFLRMLTFLETATLKLPKSLKQTLTYLAFKYVSGLSRLSLPCFTANLSQASMPHSSWKSFGFCRKYRWLHLSVYT